MTRVGYTDTDFNNSLIYARMKLLHDKTMELKKTKNVDWQNINDDETVPYFCPKGLTCYYGFPKITSSDECKLQNTYKIGTDASKQPGYKNGWYLNWNDSDKNCYKSNYLYATECNTDFDTKLKSDGLLKYDSENQICNITKAYCDAYGYKNYNANTQSCEMNAGQTVADALFGDTISRGVFGGACFK